MVLDQVYEAQGEVRNLIEELLRVYVSVSSILSLMHISDIINRSKLLIFRKYNELRFQ